MYGPGNWGTYYRWWLIQLVRLSVLSVHVTKSCHFGVEFSKVMSGDQHLFPQGIWRLQHRDSRGLGNPSPQFLIYGKHQHPPLCRNLGRGGLSHSHKALECGCQADGKNQTPQATHQALFTVDTQIPAEQSKKEGKSRQILAKSLRPSRTLLSQDETGSLAAWLSRHLAVLEQGFFSFF